MTYVPNLDNDIFISYTHIDDQPLTEGQKGWISAFHNSLLVRLRQLLGSDLTIWRDDRLTGQDDFSRVIFKQFLRTGVLVSILSPRYLNSPWCLDELRAFLEAAEKAGGASIGDKSRVFKVVKTHIPLEKHPAELQGLLGYDFYSLDPSTGRPREFLMDPGSDGMRNYWAKLEDLAYDIHETLQTIRNGNPDRPRTGSTVYLADTTVDLGLERDKIRRELMQHGHTVLPNRPLPLVGRDLAEAVTSDLRESSLSIHLVGENYGIVPEGETRSIIDIQNDLAAHHDAPGFSRIVWLAPTPAGSDPRQQSLLARLRSDVGADGRVEVLETTLEDLKTVIQDKLKAVSKKTDPPRNRDGPEHVYIICDQEDLDAAQTVADALFERGFEVMLSSFEGNDIKIREYHVESLTLCDAALIFYGSSSDIWVRTKLRDLQKAPGYGRAEDMLSRAVYVAEPATVQKDRFRSHEALVLRGTLDPFVEEIRRKKAGPA